MDGRWINGDGDTVITGRRGGHSPDWWSLYIVVWQKDTTNTRCCWCCQKHCLLSIFCLHVPYSRDCCWWTHRHLWPFTIAINIWRHKPVRIFSRFVLEKTSASGYRWESATKSNCDKFSFGASHVFIGAASFIPDMHPKQTVISFGSCVLIWCPLVNSQKTNDTWQQQKRSETDVSY